LGGAGLELEERLDIAAIIVRLDLARDGIHRALQ
jgi:hypothetical protein